MTFFLSSKRSLENVKQRSADLGATGGRRDSQSRNGSGGSQVNEVYRPQPRRHLLEEKRVKDFGS